jgi:8-oxo-dGTP diphosphatase
MPEDPISLTLSLGDALRPEVGRRSNEADALAHVGSDRSVLRLGAYSICVDSHDRLLLTRLSPGQPEEGLWTLPGGAVAFGESPEDAVLRELEEETGYKGDVIRVAATFSHMWQRSPYAKGGTLHQVGILYEVAVIGGAERAEVGGSSDRVSWIPIPEVSDLRVGPLVQRALVVIGEANGSR